MLKRLTIAGIALIAAAGCGPSEQERQAEEAARQMQESAEAIQRGAEQMAQGTSDQVAAGLQQMAQGFQQMAQGSDAKVVNFEALKELLPEVDGWTQSDARGEEVTMPMAFSQARAQYTRGDERVELENMDSAMNQLLLAPLSMFLSSGYSERSDSGFKRGATIGGSPGMEDWNNDSKRGEVTAVVGKRFIVRAEGTGVSDLAPVRQVVEAVDLAKLATLK